MLNVFPFASVNTSIYLSPLFIKSNSPPTCTLPALVMLLPAMFNACVAVWLPKLSLPPPPVLTEPSAIKNCDDVPPDLTNEPALTAPLK